MIETVRENRSERMKRAYAEKKAFVQHLEQGSRLAPLWNEETAKNLNVSMSRLAGQLLKLEKSLTAEAVKTHTEDVNGWVSRAEGLMVYGMIRATEKDNFGLKNIKEAAEFTLAEKYQSPDDLYGKLGRDLKREEENSVFRTQAEILTALDKLQTPEVSMQPQKKHIKEAAVIAGIASVAAACLGMALFHTEDKPQMYKEIQHTHPTATETTIAGIKPSPTATVIPSIIPTKETKPIFTQVSTYVKKEKPADLTRLTDWGNHANDLYKLYRDNPGWWNNNGQFTHDDFVKLMLSYELGPLVSQNERVMDDGTKVKDLLAESSTRWVYAHCQEVTGKPCSNISENDMMNWIGVNSESFRRRWRAMYYDENNMPIKPDPPKLKRITRDDGRNATLANYIVENIWNPLDPTWKEVTGKAGYTRPRYWGNISMYGNNVPVNAFYALGTGASSFLIVSEEQNNNTMNIN